MERSSVIGRTPDSCPECSGRIVQRTASERRCADCGLVLGDHRSRVASVGRRAPSRSRGPPARRNGTLSTYLGSCAHDSRHNRIRQRKQRRLRRQQRWQRQIASDSIGQSRRVGGAEIRRLCGSLGIGDQVETVAMTIFRRALEERLLYGRSCESIAAAAVYLAVRRSAVHRPLSEITTASTELRRRVTRDARHLQRELDLAVEPPQVVDYLPQIRSTLGLDERAERRAQELLDAAIEANFHSGRDPSGLAASALYTVSLLEDHSTCSQAAAASAGGVCTETIRRRYRELRDLCPVVFGTDAPTAHAPRRNSV